MMQHFYLSHCHMLHRIALIFNLIISSTVPLAPSNPHITGFDATSATVVWTVPPPNVNSPLSPVTSYILFLSEQQFNISTVVTNVSVNTHTFTGLEEFNRYTCIIAATNSIGQGPFTSPLIFNTSQAGMFQSNAGICKPDLYIIRFKD